MAGGQGWVLGGAGFLFGSACLVAVSGPPEPEPLAAAGRDPASPVSAAPAEPGALHLLRVDAAGEPQPLDEFAQAGVPPAEQPLTLADIERLVLDLHDDAVRGNALHAMWRLSQVLDAARPALERALASADGQQRHLAAAVLRHGRARASERLVAVSVEALRRQWNHPFQDTLLSATAPGAMRWLARHLESAVPHLRSGLGSDDPQQRFHCAYLLARAGHQGDTDVVVRELVEHLADNSIAGDAVMACNGLYRLGPGLLPAVRLWRRYVDGQAGQLLDLVERDLAWPERLGTGDQPSLRRVTDVYRDPARDFDLDRSHVAVW